MPTWVHPRERRGTRSAPEEAVKGYVDMATTLRPVRRSYTRAALLVPVGSAAPPGGLLSLLRGRAARADRPPCAGQGARTGAEHDHADAQPAPRDGEQGAHADHEARDGARGDRCARRRAEAGGEHADGGGGRG